MKKILAYVGAGLMIGFASCSKDVNVGSKSAQTGAKISITMKAVSPSAGTKVTLDGIDMKWEEGDSFTLFDDAGNNAQMSLADGDGGNDTGTFTGEIAENPARKAFYAIDPWTGTEGSDPTNVPVAVTADQTQAGATDFAGLGHMMISTGQVTGSVATDDMAVAFSPLTAVWDVIITNTTSPSSIMSVKIRASDSYADMPFATAGTVDITGASTPAFKPATYSNYIATTFATSQTGATVTARLAMLPVTLSGKNLQIIVMLDNGHQLIFNRPAVTRDITAGKNVQSFVDLNTPNATQLFFETFGNTASSTAMSVTAYAGYTGRGRNSIVYTGSTNANPRTLAAASSSPQASGFSGDSHLFLSANTDWFNIDNIDVTGKSAATLSVAVYCNVGGATVSTISVTPTFGTTAGSPLTLTFIPAASSWGTVIAPITIPAGTTSMSLKIQGNQASGSYVRIDDILLVDGFNAVIASASLSGLTPPTPFPTTTSYTFMDASSNEILTLSRNNTNTTTPPNLSYNVSNPSLATGTWLFTNGPYWQISMPVRADLSGVITVKIGGVWVTNATSTGPRDWTVEYSLDQSAPPSPSSWTPVDNPDYQITLATTGAPGIPLEKKFTIAPANKLVNGDNLYIRLRTTSNLSLTGAALSGTYSSYINGSITIFNQQ